MSCLGCSVKTKDGTPLGCRQNGGCHGGCNRLNTFDWLSLNGIADVEDEGIVEISFHNGTRKEFCTRPARLQVFTGDQVVVESKSGRDIGCITLSGELVRLQMKKKRVSPERVKHKILRKATERDLQILQQAREREHPTLLKARIIARSLNLDMKIGDVEYQADGRKATFYYTADGRVDFRELIRHYAREFRVKIEMRQIGARQEAGRIGGIGSCGRELCCSSWLTTFKTVSTAAARYQSLAINQAKLSGQCGRLKCCLNFELDTYMEALKDFPKGAEKLKTQQGTAVLFKRDIFEGLMYYAYSNSRAPSNKVYTLTIEQAREVCEMNKRGELPEDLGDFAFVEEDSIEEEDIGFDSINDVVELPPEERRKRRNKRNRGRRNRQNRSANRQKQSKPKEKDRKKTEGENSKKGKAPVGKSKSRNRKKNQRNSGTKRKKNGDKKKE